MALPYDALVIGSGVNGLVAATRLARAGLRVLVLERRETVGGAMATEEIAPGFRVDSCAHDAGWIPPGLIAELELARHGLELVRTEASVFTPLEDGRSLTLWADRDRTRHEVAAHSPRDAERWIPFTDRIAELSGFLETVYSAPPPQVTSRSFGDFVGMLGLGRRVRGLGKSGMLELLRTLPMSVAELLDDWFEGEALKGTIGAAGITRIFQGPRSGGTAFVLIHHQVGRVPGAIRAPDVVRGGAGALARALAEAARSAGVEIRTGTEVAQILVEHPDGSERAAGVALTSGEEIRARRVVSSADPRRTLLSLLGAARLEPEVVRAVQNIKLRGAVAKVNLALGELPRFSAAPGGGERLHGAISISPSLDYLERAYDDAKHGGISRQPYLEARIPSLLDHSLAPAGRHVMSVQVQYAPYALRPGTWDTARREALGDVVIATLGRHAPNLPDAVLHRQVLSPKDLEDEYALTEASANHGELTLDQILFMRPLPGWSRYRTPVESLYLCGAGAHPGGGITGMAGFNAAREIVKDAKKS